MIFYMFQAPKTRFWLIEKKNMQELENQFIAVIHGSNTFAANQFFPFFSQA